MTSRSSKYTQQISTSRLGTKQLMASVENILKNHTTRTTRGMTSQYDDFVMSTTSDIEIGGTHEPNDDFIPSVDEEIFIEDMDNELDKSDMFSPISV